MLNRDPHPDRSLQPARPICGSVHRFSLGMSHADVHGARADSKDHAVTASTSKTVARPVPALHHYQGPH